MSPVLRVDGSILNTNTISIPNTISAPAIDLISYRGWADSIRISNGVVEAVVVPAIGRVMRFGWADGGENVLWEDESLSGAQQVADSEGWFNFGGDKTWPSPQSSWKENIGRLWPPPRAFDSQPYGAEVEADGVVIASRIDAHYGVRVVRRIRLDSKQPVMHISTELRKVTGAPVRCGIWNITQMRSAERVYALLPSELELRHAYRPLMGSASTSVKVAGRLLSLAGDLAKKVKIGTRARHLLWVGRDDTMRLDAPDRVGEFPDSGSRSEIYTSPTPQAYVELETLSPLATLDVSQQMEWGSTYTLARRSLASPLEEARKTFLQL